MHLTVSKHWLTPALVMSLLVGILGNIAACRQEPDEDPWFQVVPPEYSQLSPKVMELQKEGHFDEAVSLVAQSLKGQRSDDVLFRMIAYTHFSHAQADSQQRKKWTTLGVEFCEKALQANRSDIVNLYNVGEGYLIAGQNLADVSKSESCQYYQKAVNILEEVSVNPILTQEQAVIEGENHRMAPWRKRLNEKLSEAKNAYMRCAEPVSGSTK